MAQSAEHHVPAMPGAVAALIHSGHVAPGDRVILDPGDHGTVEIMDRHFDPALTITTDPRDPAKLNRLAIKDSSGLVVIGLTVISEPDAPLGSALVEVSEGRAITLDRLSIASAPDSTDWTAADWQSHARHGILVSGTDITITGSDIRTVRHGIFSFAENAWIEGNTIALFSGDGLRGLGNNSDYIGNRITTCVDVDDNHDDGFQSWSVGLLGRPGTGVVRNVRLIGNWIENGDHPLACTLQGIGLFDGIYEDWTIRGNTVIVNNWHGITVMGARRVTVEDNIVVDALPGQPGAPWIAVTGHKDGRAAEASRVLGNLTQPWAGGSRSPFKPPHPGVIWENNQTVSSLAEALELR